jgi:hypothetical protein
MICSVKDGKATMLADTSMQPDWNQTEPAQKDFIRNKPDIAAILEAYAPVESPAFIGSPTVPTPPLLS